MDVTTILFAFIFLNTVLVALLGSLTFIFFMKFWKLPGTSLPDDKLPFVSVVVPARNEEDKIRRCLESLAKQNYLKFEIIIVDDRSVDRTPEIIKELCDRYPVIKSLKSNEAPPGWTGKSNALVQAVEHANGEWYVFIDADTMHTPESLRLAVSYAISKGSDLISFMPVQELGSFWEKLIMPVLLGSFLVGDPFNKINDLEDPRSYAYGQYILVRRSAYEAVNGHHSVKDQILDDIMFARVVKGSGFRVNAACGQRLYRVRMYTDLSSTWFGWTKNAFALLECNTGYLALVLFLINAGMLFPWFHAAIVLNLFAANGFSPQWGWTLCCVIVEFATLMIWYTETTKYYRGISWYHFFMLPAGVIAVTALYLNSAYLVWSGSKVRWKDRTYVVNSEKSIEPEAAALQPTSLLK